MNGYAPLQRRARPRPRPGEPARAADAPPAPEAAPAPTGVPRFLRAGGAGADAGPRPLAVPAVNPARLPPGVAAALADGPGSPLPDGPRARWEARLGADLRGVRLRTGAAADASARALGTRAYAVGADVVVRGGAPAFGSAEGERLLGHELAHVVQNARGTAPARATGASPAAEAEAARAAEPGPSPAPFAVREAPGAAVQGYDGLERITLTVGADPLGRYTALRGALEPEQWARLSRAARARTHGQLLRTGAIHDPADRDRLGSDALRELQVPLSALLRPAVPGPAEGAFAERLWPHLAGVSPDARAAGRVVRDEIMRRWVELVPALGTATVTVALVDPEGSGEGDAWLAFEYAGRPLRTEDGALWAPVVDAAFGGQLSVAVAEVSGQARTVGEAADVAHGLESAMVLVRRDVVDADPHRVPLNRARGYDRQFRALRQSALDYRDAHPETARLLASVLERMEGFVRDSLGPAVAAHQRHHALAAPEETVSETYEGAILGTLRDAERDWDRGGWSAVEGGAEYTLAFGLTVFDRIANLVTFGYTDTSGEAARAYRRGDLSRQALDELRSDALVRSLVVGTVTVALMFATAGLAGPVLGSTPTLGASVAYWGGTSAASGIVSLGVESAYTAGMDQADPYAQAMWGRGVHGWQDYALAGVLGFGLGAAGGAVPFFRGGASSELALASQGGMRQAAARAGWVAEDLGVHGMRITGEGFPGMILVDAQGWRVMMPAGNGMRVVAEGAFVGGGAAPGARPPRMLGPGGALPVGAADDLFAHAGGMGGGGGPLVAPGGGGGGSTALALRPRVLVEPFVGPDLMSPTSILLRNPGARVVALEASRPPSAAQQQIFRAFGGEYLPQHMPALGGASVDEFFLRYPLPHAQAMESAAYDFGLAMRASPRANPLDVMRQVEAAAETVTNVGPHALQQLRPGGTMEIIFYERAIAGEAEGLVTTLRHTDPSTGVVYGFEVAEGLSTVRRAVATPYSGFAVPAGDTASRMVLRKVAIPPAAPPGGTSPTGGGGMGAPGTPGGTGLAPGGAAVDPLLLPGTGPLDAASLRRLSSMPGYAGPAPAMVRPPGQAVELARLRLADPARYGAFTPADAQALLQRTVFDSRVAMVQRIARSEGLPPEAIGLEASRVGGLCGLGQGLCTFRLEDMGVLPRSIMVHQAFDAFPGPATHRHAFNVVQLPDGRAYLVDITARQFWNPASARPRHSGAHGALMRQDPRASAIADELIANGYVELTDVVANQYGQMLSEGAAGRVFTVDDLLRGSTVELDFERHELIGSFPPLEPLPPSSGGGGR